MALTLTKDSIDFCIGLVSVVDEDTNPFIQLLSAVHGFVTSSAATDDKSKPIPFSSNIHTPQRSGLCSEPQLAHFSY